MMLHIVTSVIGGGQDGGVSLLIGHLHSTSGLLPLVVVGSSNWHALRAVCITVDTEQCEIVQVVEH